MLLFVYTTTRKRYVIFTCRYFKLSWNTTALRQSSCRNFSCSSVTKLIALIPSRSIRRLSWILKDCIEVQEKKRKSLSCVHVPHKTWNKAFLRRSRAVTAKKCTKNPIAFLPFSLPLPTSLLKLPITVQREGGGWGQKGGGEIINFLYMEDKVPKRL